MTSESNYKSREAEHLAKAAYEGIIERRTVQVEQLRLPTAVGETFVLRFGDPSAPPLVLLHGSAANSSSWAGEAAAYARHFLVHAIDLPGETGKSTPARPPYEGPAYPNWLAQVLDGLALDRVSIAGLSLGGWVGMRFAAAAAGRVERLALIAPGGLAAPKKSFIIKAAFYLPFGMWGIRRITNMVFSPSQAPPGTEEAFAFGLRNYNARRDNLPLVTDDELRSLTMPLFFIGGDSDALLDTAAGAERVKRVVPHAEVRVLRNAGHGLVAVAGELLPFLNAATREPSAPPQ